MAKNLSDEQVLRFHRDGFVFPMDGLTADEAAAAHACLERYEHDTGHDPQQTLTLKSHLPFRLFSDIIRHPHVLDAVEDVIGPDILCWGSSFFVKEAHDPAYISWHADTYYYGIEPQETVTAWIAFTPSNRVSGCIRCIPGSHLQESEFEERPDADNILTRGQTASGVDESQSVYMPLEAGQFSMHHECTVHSSEPNNADHRRVGYSIHYCPTHVRQSKYDDGKKPSAALVRGVDHHGYWEHEPRTEVEFDAAAAARMIEIRRGFIGRQRR